jgi:hypothetical protein
MRKGLSGSFSTSRQYQSTDLKKFDPIRFPEIARVLFLCPVVPTLKYTKAGGYNDGLGNPPSSRQVMHTGECRLWRGRIRGEFPALPMGFKADHAEHDMTPFLRGCLTNRANVFQTWITSNHFQPLWFNQIIKKWSQLIIFLFDHINSQF